MRGKTAEIPSFSTRREVVALREQVRELERLLGRKELEVQLLREALEEALAGPFAMIERH